MPGKFTLNIFHPRKWLIQSIQPEGKQRREMRDYLHNLHSPPLSCQQQEDAVDSDQKEEDETHQIRDLGFETESQISTVDGVTYP